MPSHGIQRKRRGFEAEEGVKLAYDWFTLKLLPYFHISLSIN